jgi:ABC-type Fe3+-siderophore transport system permease subunit
MVLQLVGCETVLILILVFCVGYMKLFELAMSSLRHQINNPGLNLYSPVGISNAKTPDALSAEYYYITMTVLSYLVVSVLVVASISACALIIMWCTRNENVTIERILDITMDIIGYVVYNIYDITKTLISSLKAWNRQAGALMSSLMASMNHGFRTHYVHVGRKVVSSLRAGLLFMKYNIRCVCNTIATLVLSLVARLRKHTANWEVSNQQAVTSDSTELVLRRQLLQANEQLAQERDKALCIICLDTPREVLLKPCKHYCLCSSCTNGLRTCPVCNQRIRETEVIYNA